MPVEIKELHIRAVIDPGDRAPKTALSASELEKLKQEIIRECVERILNQLQEKTER